MSRTVVFSFFDGQGIVRRYVTYFLEQLQKFADDILIVVNGALTEESREKLEAITPKIIVRDNEGFDIYGYKVGLESLFDTEAFQAIDEVILCNMTCYGPIFPFEELFDEMARRDCDFWGLTKHPEQDKYLLANHCGYIHEHIMSYFTVFRRRLLHSDDFRRYWRDLPAITTKMEAVGFYETAMTKHFEDLGYTSSAYLDRRRYEGKCYNYTLFYPYDLLAKDRVPLLKRRSFINPDIEGLLNTSAVYQAAEAIRYIREETEYDEGYIWEDLLQTQRMPVYKTLMHLGHVLPTVSMVQTDWLHEKKISLILFIDKPYALDNYSQYVASLPRTAQVVLLYADDALLSPIQAVVGAAKENIRVIKVDRKRILYDALVVCKDLLAQSDYTCFLLYHNAKSEPLSLTEEDANRYFYRCMLASESYINNILSTFEAEPYLGVMDPRALSFSRYYGQYIAKYERRDYQQRYRFIYDSLALPVPFNDQVCTSLEPVFWARKGVLDGFYRYVEAEPLLVRSEKAMEYFLPMVVQAGGHYVSSVILADEATAYIDNYAHANHRLVSSLFDNMKNRNHHSIFAMQSLLAPLDYTKEEVRRVAVQAPFSAREILTIVKNKLCAKLGRGLPAGRAEGKEVLQATISLFPEGDRIVCRVNAPYLSPAETYLLMDGVKYYPKRELTENQRKVIAFYRDHSQHCVFFELPLTRAKNVAVDLYAQEQERAELKWVSSIQYNALELKKHRLYVRIEKGRLYIQRWGKFIRSVLRARQYSVRDKLLFAFAAVNPLHPITLVGEILSVSDNAFQLFKYALSKGERVYYVVSDVLKAAEKDPRIRKHMVVLNGRRHILATLFARRWIGSFSLASGLLPTSDVLKDIHYALLPSEWIFIPHGITSGDKTSANVHKYVFGNPSLTVVSSPYEEKAFSSLYEFQPVTCLGYPRMDKWYGAELNQDEVFMFFTWRQEWLNIPPNSDFDFTQTPYFNTVVRVVKAIRACFPEKRIYYTFHNTFYRPAIRKMQFDTLIKAALEETDVEFLYLNKREDVVSFNEHFRSAKYLITDFSSVAFDFSYKEGGIAISYVADDFLQGHYQMLPDFDKLHAGVSVRSIEALLSVMAYEKPTAAMEAFRQDFFPYLDAHNSQRVYQAIFDSKKKIAKEPVQRVDGKCRRLGIYFLFDVEGVADAYVIEYVRQLHTVCDQVCVVVNGELTQESVKGLQAVSNQLILRENEGFDSAAYKQAILHYGYDAIARDFDEVVLCNYTTYGPIYPFCEMFDAMQARACDFWGHNRFLGNPDWKIFGVPVAAHLQSYFMVFRKDILTSRAFRDYWHTLAVPKTYHEAISCHELRCTDYFERWGFLSDAYMPSAPYSRLSKVNTALYYPYRQLVKDRSPLLKRKTGFIKDEVFQYPSRDRHTFYAMIAYIKKRTDYDVRLIKQNIDRTQDMRFTSDLQRARLRLLKYTIFSLMHPGKSRRMEDRYLIPRNMVFLPDKFEKVFQTTVAENQPTIIRDK